MEPTCKSCSATVQLTNPQRWKGLCYKCRRSEECKKYKDKHAEKIKLAKQKQYLARQANGYTAEDMAKAAAKSKKYREANREKYLLARKVFRDSNKTKLKTQYKTWYDNNKEYNINRVKEYSKANREKVRLRKANKMKTDLQFRLSERLRARFSTFLRRHFSGKNPGGSAVRDLGCSIGEFIYYIESKFQSGMSWDNWGQFTWHIDHIQPLAAFDLTDPEQVKVACHYTNLQPLWAKDNHSKCDRLLIA